MTGQMDASGLPVPQPEALEHSRRVGAAISDAIGRAGGAIRFADFMALALYAPGLGYYSAGARKFGAAGDFVTAPEISPLFPACIARACVRVLDSLGGGEIVEIGGGSGAMAAEILSTVDSDGCLPDRYRILEVSADLRDRQRRLLSQRVPHLVERVRWIDDLPTGVEGVVLANEVLDALPFERFRIDPCGPVYVGVGVEDGGFGTVALPADDPLLEQSGLIAKTTGAPLEAGYTSEWCPRIPAFVTGLAGGLKAGLLLLVDYGLPRRQLYHPERSAGTMMCHYRHRAHRDPFLYPGLQDITAWVDFTAVAEAATAAGLVLDGFTTQAHFLLGSGIAEAAGLDEGGARRRLETAGQVRKLTLPGEMGERFKVIGFSREWDGSLPGLTGKDLSGSL